MLQRKQVYASKDRNRRAYDQAFQEVTLLLLQEEEGDGSKSIRHWLNWRQLKKLDGKANELC